MSQFRKKTEEQVFKRKLSDSLAKECKYKFNNI